MGSSGIDNRASPASPGIRPSAICSECQPRRPYRQLGLTLTCNENTDGDRRSDSIRVRTDGVRRGISQCRIGTRSRLEAGRDQRSCSNRCYDTGRIATPKPKWSARFACVRPRPIDMEHWPVIRCWTANRCITGSVVGTEDQLEHGDRGAPPAPGMDRYPSASQAEQQATTEYPGNKGCTRPVTDCRNHTRGDAAEARPAGTATTATPSAPPRTRRRSHLRRARTPRSGSRRRPGRRWLRAWGHSVQVSGTAMIRTEPL